MAVSVDTVTLDSTQVVTVLVGSQYDFACPLFAEFEATSGYRKHYRFRWILFVLAVCAWLLLVLAATRPLHLGPERSLPVTGRDLMLAVDLSRKHAGA